MRVLFVFPDLSAGLTHYTGVLSHGVALLSAVLRQEGHETALLHLVRPPARDEFAAAVAAARPDLVAFSTNSHYAHRLPAWVAWARAATRAPIAVGGVHASVAPDAVTAIEGVDFVGVGEGEESLPELCRALAAGADPSGVANFRVRNGDGWRVNPPRPFRADLDGLPDPDYGLFDFADLYNVRRGYFPFIMSRGCGWNCSYCCSDTLRRAAGGGGRFWRFLSPEAAVAQLRRLLDRHPVPTDTVQFLDTVLFPNKAWLRRFAPIYRERIGIPFNANLRADLVDEETTALLLAAGCRTIRFGIESGDPWLTEQVLVRRLTVEDIRRAFDLLERAGIERWAYNMVGLPHEDLRRALRTIRLNGEVGPDLAIPFIFYPYPGTALHELCAREGWLTGREFDHYFQGVMLEQPGFARGDVLFLHRLYRPLIRLYGLARGWPERRRRRWGDLVDAVLSSRLLPRSTIAHACEAYRSLRHRVGEDLVARSPRLYRMLGGTDPI